MNINSRILDRVADIKSYLASHPVLWNVFFIFKKYRHKWVKRRHVICIEGFPRSANTFAVGSFMLANREIYAPRFIVNHTHLPMQIVRAVRLGVPCIVLIRDPISAIASWMLVRNYLSTITAVRQYICFYECIRPVLDSVVVAEFDSVIENFMPFITQVNVRFGTKFNIAEMNDENRQMIFDGIRKRHRGLQQTIDLLAIPSEERNRRNAEFRKQIAKIPEIEQAQELYEYFTEKSKKSAVNA